MRCIVIVPPVSSYDAASDVVQSWAEVVRIDRACKPAVREQRVSKSLRDVIAPKPVRRHDLPAVIEHEHDAGGERMRRFVESPSVQHQLVAAYELEDLG